MTYVVPSAVVADVIKDGHQAWLKAPGARGQPHKDSPARQLLPTYPFAGWLDEYREAWDLTGKQVGR